MSDWEKSLSEIKAVKSKENSKTELVEEKLIKEIVEGYKYAIRFYAWVALIPVFVSITLFIIIFFNTQEIEVLQILASTLIVSLSAFPIREIVNRKEKISILNILIKKIRLLKANPIEKEVLMINEVFWGLVNKTLSKSNK